MCEVTWLGLTALVSCQRDRLGGPLVAWEAIAVRPGSCRKGPVRLLGPATIPLRITAQ